MQHSFDIGVAQRYGVNCAVILTSIRFWIEKNKANGKHFYDGRYWTYNSVAAFSVLFPYLTEKQIRRAIEALESDGVLLSGNYNKSVYDRTKWYSISEYGMSLFEKSQSANMEEHRADISTASIDCENASADRKNASNSGGVDSPTRANVSAQEGEPIPDIKPDINKELSKKVIKARSQAQALNSTLVTDNTLDFEKFSKQTNIFAVATEKYGAERCKEALHVVDQYIDTAYPGVHKRSHPKLNKALRMSHAMKLLNCMDETDAGWDEIIGALNDLLKGANCDPTILYATTPQVLGYWLIKQEGFSYDMVNDSDYAPVAAHY